MAVRIDSILDWEVKTVPFRTVWQYDNGTMRNYDLTQRVLAIGKVGFVLIAETEDTELQFIMPGGQTLPAICVESGILCFELSVLTSPRLAFGVDRREYELEVEVHEGNATIKDFREAKGQSED